MLDLQRGLGDGVQIPLPAASLYRGLVDLKDRDTYKPSSGRNQSPYDRMMELYSTGVGDLPPVKDALRAVVNEDGEKLREIFGFKAYKFGYWKTAKPIDGIDVTESDTRLGIVRGVLDIYKKKAYAQVLKEYPKLQQAEDRLDGEKSERKQSQTENRIEALRAFSDSTLP